LPEETQSNNQGKGPEQGGRFSWRQARAERRRNRGPGRYLFWGLFLILWAVLIVAMQQNWIAPRDIWKSLITGLGAIFLILAVRSALDPATRSGVIGRVIPGTVLLVAGLTVLLDWSALWPIALILAGIAVIAVSWYLQREIQKRRVTQESLRESEIKYGHIIDSTNSVILELDKNGDITFANRYALELFGYQKAELLGHNLVGTIIPSGASAEAERDALIGGVVNSPQDFLQDEKESVSKSGEKIWMVWAYRPIMDESHNLKEILCTGIDRTASKRADETATRQLKEETAVQERTRLARDLHDTVTQTLFSTSLIAEVLPRVWERNRDEGLSKLEEVRQLTRGALAEMRTLLFELRPAALADAELNDLLRQLAESVIGRARVAVSFQADGAAQIPADVKIALYRIAQEALNNIARHSGASRAEVVLHGQPGRINLVISDNGQGFDPTQVASGSFGLDNMRERAGQIGAAFEIRSAPGRGTAVSVDWRDRTGEGLQ
jgi:PAS domain S-box-containing protein